jgi:hypothetical protein
MDRIANSVQGVGFDSTGKTIFVDENLAAGVDGTDVPSVWLNGVQGELQALQGLDGYVPVAGDNGQSLAALVAKFPGIVAAGRNVGTPGFLKLPGGLILQWVRNHTAAADGTGAALNTWVFPIPFQSIVLSYCYVNTNEATYAPVGILQAAVPSLTEQTIAHLSAPPGAQVAFSGFVLGI